jgi:hypothetical protein
MTIRAIHDKRFPIVRVLNGLSSKRIETAGRAQYFCQECHMSPRDSRFLIVFTIAKRLHLSAADSRAMVAEIDKFLFVKF